MINTLLQNEHFWVYIAFFLFFIIFGKMIYKAFVDFLKQNVEIIKTDVVDSEELLNHSRTKLKEKYSDLQSLEKKLATIHKNAETIGQNISETFFENLSIKEQQLKDTFQNFLLIEELLNKKQLSVSLINDSIEIVNNILNNNLTSQLKKDLLKSAINELPKQLKELSLRTK